MKDPRTITIIVMNIVLGVLVLILVWGVAAEVICEFVGRLRKRHSAERELDRDMERYFGHTHFRK